MIRGLIWKLPYNYILLWHNWFQGCRRWGVMFLPPPHLILQIIKKQLKFKHVSRKCDYKCMLRSQRSFIAHVWRSCLQFVFILITSSGTKLFSHRSFDVNFQIVFGRYQQLVEKYCVTSVQMTRNWRIILWFKVYHCFPILVFRLLYLSIPLLYVLSNI